MMKSSSINSAIMLLVVSLIMFPNMLFSNNNIRKATNAGRFYPADKEALTTMLDTLINNDKPLKYSGYDIQAVVAPHAGYIFSGKVASKMYRELAERSYDIVIIVAPSHHQSFAGSSVFKGTHYETPLGKIAVNKEIAKNIADFHDNIMLSYDGHNAGKSSEEHSIEVQLPFIQTVLPNAEIVPISMGTQNFQTADILMQAIVETVKSSDKNILLLASTDLSHFHDRQTARSMDIPLVRAFQSYDYFKLGNKVFSNEWEACGGAPLISIMMAAEKLGATKASPVLYLTSADVDAGRDNPDRVVGYFSGIMLDYPYPEDISHFPRIQDQEKEFIIDIAKKGLNDCISVDPDEKAYFTPPQLGVTMPVFVTIRKNGELRGCMGHLFTDDALPIEIRKVGKMAGCGDPRFNKLTKKEIESLEIEVSILSPFKRILNFDEFEIGKHGIYMKVNNSSGLFLPSVATGQGWNKETTLEMLGRKAGLSTDAYKNPNAQFYIFETYVIE